MTDKHMTGKPFTENYMKKEREEIRQGNLNVIHMIIFACLPLFFAGYLYALYRGNNGNGSSYSLLILAFSAAGSNFLFTGKKTEQKIWNILIKLDAVLFLIWTVITVIQLIWK